MKKVLLSLVLMFFIGAVYLTFGKQAEPMDSGSQSAELLLPGTYGSKTEFLTLVDKSRSVDANGDYKGSPERSFGLYVWRPKERPASPQPLMVYSHGFMSDGKGGEYLAQHLSSHGYTVVAPTFPLTHYSAPGGANSADVVNQPADVRFILDTMLARNGDKNDTLFNTIDANRIVAAGLSLGGMTTTLASFHPEYADLRISAAISIAGPTYMFSKRFFADRSIPFMMIASPQDALVNYADNAANIRNKVDGAVLVSIEDASHTGFGGPAKWLRWMNNPDSIGCDTVMDNIELSASESWLDQIGSPDIGVMQSELPTMCSMNPLPTAMNPLRQHQLTTLAVSSFLNCHFSPEINDADTNCLFLNSVFQQEIAEVRVES